MVLHPGGALHPFEDRAPLPPDSSQHLEAPAARDGVPAGLTPEDATRAYVARALRDADGNKTEAARKLGIGRNRLARLLKPNG